MGRLDRTTRKYIDDRVADVLDDDLAGVAKGTVRYTTQLEYFNGSAWVPVPGTSTQTTSSVFPLTLPLMLT